MNRVVRVFYIGSFFVSLSSIAAYASSEPVCHSVPECEQLIHRAQARLQELKPSMQLGPLARNADGSIATMSRDQARTYCDSIGKRIPHIKELALALNPRGVHPDPSPGHQRRAVYNRNGFEEFYNDPTTYLRPLGEEAEYMLWSSSNHPFNDFYNVYAFSLGFGFIYGVDPNQSRLRAVRCIDK